MAIFQHGKVETIANDLKVMVVGGRGGALCLSLTRAGVVLRADWRDARHYEGLRACGACVRAAAALLGSKPLACLLCGDVGMAVAIAVTALSVTCDIAVNSPQYRSPTRRICGGCRGRGLFTSHSILFGDSAHSTSKQCARFLTRL